jgi:hypothetical protein
MSRIVKLTYGKDGLVAFMERVFEGCYVQKRLDFNYYFALKSNLAYLET